MIRRVILLFVQRFLWKKLLKGSFKSKIMSLVSIFFVAVLAGTLFATFFLNMSFAQGAGWAWQYIVNGSSSLIRMFF